MTYVVGFRTRSVEWHCADCLPRKKEKCNCRCFSLPMNTKFFLSGAELAAKGRASNDLSDQKADWCHYPQPKWRAPWQSTQLTVQFGILYLQETNSTNQIYLSTWIMSLLEHVSGVPQGGSMSLSQTHLCSLKFSCYTCQDRYEAEEQYSYADHGHSTYGSFH